MLPNVKFNEIPRRVAGYDLPDTDIGFAAYPTASTTAITAYVGTVKW